MATPPGPHPPIPPPAVAGAPMATPADRLAPYRAKRDASRTPEPLGDGIPRPRLFVVQQHRARRLHWDLRLELDGVLASWALPKRPSLDPAEKRLAVRVEDHPVEYADFEGVIPQGAYGAGAVIVWDLGQWVPLEDPRAGMAAGTLRFELHGYKLRGGWALVRRKPTGRAASRDWLLVKRRDPWAAPDRVPGDESVLSGLTTDELATGTSPRADAVRAAIARLDPAPPRRPVALATVQPMLARQAERPFSRAGWLYEIKYDGYRILAGHDAGAAHLRYRGGEDASAQFPEITRAVAGLPCRSAILDGELVVVDEQGRPSFQQLQRRVQLVRPVDVARAAVATPATYFAFDLLAFEGRDLRPLPLAARKRLLRALLPAVGPLRYADHVETQGEAVFAEARRLGLEGVMAKRADAPYRAGRQATWLKLRGERTDDFVIVGHTRPGGTRAGFGALLLATHEGERLVYAGRVGTGFTEAQLASIRARLDADRRPTAPCSGALPSAQGITWVEPRQVCEVRFLERTAGGLLRQPTFVRLRDDKRPAECVAAGAGPPPPRVTPTNRDKVFWPDDGVTKGDLLDYHRSIAPWILHYLRDRPLVMARHPEGIAGPSFFQKNVPDRAPPWLRTVRVWSEESAREIAYVVCDDLESLLWVVNLGTIGLHVWASRVATLERPDWCILDLDPKSAPFAAVVRVARAVHELCEAIGLPSFVKTSGQAGLHVLLPLCGQCTFGEAKTLGALLAHVVAAEQPEAATVARALASRRGRVYVDALQNGHGKLLAVPFGVRPVPGATVSTPLDWSEVGPRLDPRRFTLRTVPRRMARRGEDPMRAVLSSPVDVPRALEALERRLAERTGAP